MATCTCLPPPLTSSLVFRRSDFCQCSSPDCLLCKQANSFTPRLSIFLGCLFISLPSAIYFCYALFLQLLYHSRESVFNFRSSLKSFTTDPIFVAKTHPVLLVVSLDNDPFTKKDATDKAIEALLAGELKIRVKHRIALPGFVYDFKVCCRI